MKSGREHADNGVDSTINLQVRLREVSRRSELRLPVSIAYKNGGTSAFFGVAGAEIPPKDWLNTEDLEKVGGHARGGRARRLRSPRNRRDAILVLCNRPEAAVLIAKVVKVRVREVRPAALGVDLEDGHDAVRIGVRQRPEQHAVDHAEDCRRRADGQRERKDHDCGGAGVFAELPEAITAIGDHRAEPAAKLLFTNLFFHLFNTSQFDPRGTLRFLGRHAGTNVFFSQQFEMGMNFVVEVHLYATR